MLITQSAKQSQSVHIMLTFVLLTLIASHVCCGGRIEHSTFVRCSICDVPTRIDLGCSRQVGIEHGGLLACASECSKNNDTCIGSSVDSNGACYVHNKCLILGSVCTTVSKDHAFLSSPYANDGAVADQCQCLNGGVMDQSIGKCRCGDGLHGDYCQKYLRKCSELAIAGYDMGYYKVQLDIHGDGSLIIPVMCVVRGKTANVLLFLNSGRQDFNKTWQEYRNGFFLDKDHYWLGLDNFYTLLSGITTNQLTFQIQYRDEFKSRRKYFDIGLSDDASGYALIFDMNQTEVASTNGPDLGDCIANYQAFSTWDRDDDGDENENCAAKFGSGWWYTAGCGHRAQTCDIPGLDWGLDRFGPLADTSNIVDSFLDVSF